jgi:hypothetical protein
MIGICFFKVKIFLNYVKYITNLEWKSEIQRWFYEVLKHFLKTVFYEKAFLKSMLT